MKILLHTFFLFSVFLTGCAEVEKNQKDTKQNKPVDNSEAAEGSSLLEHDKRLLSADSLVFLYYKDPHGIDSLRYTRYYVQYSVTDTSVIALLLENLNGRTEKSERIKPCRSEGKIWCFTKGKVFQTLYFSDQNEECRFIYIIKNGQFYYSKLSNQLARKLAALKSYSTELPNEG